MSAAAKPLEPGYGRGTLIHELNEGGCCIRSPVLSSGEAGGDGDTDSAKVLGLLGHWARVRNRPAGRLFGW
jgi:hypothetical protein